MKIKEICKPHKEQGTFLFFDNKLSGFSHCFLLPIFFIVFHYSSPWYIKSEFDKSSFKNEVKAKHCTVPKKYPLGNPWASPKYL